MKDIENITKYAIIKPINKQTYKIDKEYKHRFGGVYKNKPPQQLLTKEIQQIQNNQFQNLKHTHTMTKFELKSLYHPKLNQKIFPNQFVILKSHPIAINNISKPIIALINSIHQFNQDNENCYPLITITLYKFDNNVSMQYKRNIIINNHHQTMLIDPLLIRTTARIFIIHKNKLKKYDKNNPKDIHNKTNQIIIDNVTNKREPILYDGSIKL